MAVWLSYAFQTLSIAYPVVAFMKEGLPIGVLESLLINHPSLRVAAADATIPPIVSKNYGSNGFTVDGFLGGIQIAIDYAKSLGMPTGIFNEVRALFEVAKSAGYGGKDVYAVAEALSTDVRRISGQTL